MKNKHSLGSPDYKTYRSTIQETSNQTARPFAQYIAAKILNQQFNEAYKMCSTNNFKQFSKLTILCQEFYLLKLVINNEIGKEKQNSWVISNNMSQQFKSTLQSAIKYKQSWNSHKKYYQQIDASIKQLMAEQSYDKVLISGVNEYLQKIKESLFNLSLFISNLKKQESKLKQQKNTLQKANKQQNRSIKSLNKVIEKKNQYIKIERDNMLKKFRERREELQAFKCQTHDHQRNLQQKLNVKNSLISSLQNQNKQLKQDLNQIKTQNQKLQSLLVVQQQQTQKHAKRIKDFEISSKDWLQQKKKYRNQIKQKNETINSLISDLQSSNKVVEDLQSQHRQNRQIIDELTAKIQQLESRCQILDNQIVQNFVNIQTQTSNFQEEMIDLHLQKQQLASQLNIQYQQKHALTAKLEDTQMELQRVKEQKTLIQEHKLHLDKENDELTQLINHLTEQLQKVKQDYQYAENLIEGLKENIPKAVQAQDQGINTLLSLEDLDNIQKRIVKDQQVISNYEKQINVSNKNLVVIQQSKVQINRKYQQLQNSYAKIVRDIDLSKIQRKDLFFIGKVLDEQPEARQYLKSVIQQAQGKTIRKTVFLYQLDTLNKINIHKYIDNIPHIILLIKTVTGWIVGGYTQGPFYPQTKSTKNGLIISISGRQSFGLKVPNTRAISYDDYFIIFGNSEIRVKIQEFKLFSNFAINSSYYDSREHKVEMITGEKNVREVQVQHIQVFQLEFY